MTEKLDIKESLFSRIRPYLRDDAILTSNTSGLSVNDMAATLDDSLKKRFLVTHFFNPPRYMYLLEIIPCDATEPAVLEFMARVGEEQLGKGVVFAKDTPNFIANRIGIFSMALTLRAMIDDGYTVEEVDALTGPVIGRPKSASFRTADLVGLDVFVHASRTVYEGAPEDEQRQLFQLPDVIERMVKEGFLGEKTGKGFYKKIKRNGKSEILTLDLDTFDYRPRERASFPSVEMAKAIEDPVERIKAVVSGKDRGAEFVWRLLSETLVYSANRLGEIAGDIVQIDNAMKWGFNWKHGPFELWDALGVEATAARLEKEGCGVPAAVTAVLESQSKRFYGQGENSRRTFFVPGTGHQKLAEREAVIDLDCPGPDRFGRSGRLRLAT